MEKLDELSKRVNDIFEPKIKDGGIVFWYDIAECFHDILGYPAPSVSSPLGWYFPASEEKIDSNLYLTED